MQDKRREHIVKIMKKYKPEDYDRMAKDHLEMMGEWTEEDLEYLKKIWKMRKISQRPNF